MGEFFTKFTKGLEFYTSPLIKVVLNIIYHYVIELYNVDKTDYSYIYSYLIFNYLISRNLQEMYGISPSKLKIVREYNLVIRVNFSNAEYMFQYTFL